jgi:uncharacterized protein YjbI with pentapeptide repeats
MWKRWAQGLIGVAAVVLAVVIVWALLVPGADWLARHDISAATGSLAKARDAARGRLLTLGAGLLAAGALVFTARNFILSREGQVTERYTKAIEQLGSDKLDVRIGGIYALERIARDSKKDHPTVMEVLTAFIRDHSREPWPPPDTGSSRRIAAPPRALSSTNRTQRPARTVRYLAARASSSTGNPPEQDQVTRPDVQAAVTVVGRRNAKRDISPIDLTGANLTGANLTGAHLSSRYGLNRADLTGANLTGAHLTWAILTGANLTRADLTRAHLDTARLDRAELTRADLTGASLGEVHLGGARLDYANLTRAYLYGADFTAGADFPATWLSGTNLTDANLSGADFTNAHMPGANLSGANIDGATAGGGNIDGVKWPENLTGVRWLHSPPPGGWVVDGDSGRLKRVGRLSNAITRN